MGSNIIEECSFGSIVINGRRHRSDLIIYPDGRIREPWYRNRGHYLSFQDIKDLAHSAPDVIVSGTGMSGGVKPDPNLGDILAERDIEFVFAPNPEAVERFNQLAKDKRVGACFHLTC